MRIMMSYGKQGLEIDLPDWIHVDTIQKKPMPVLPDPVVAVRDALANPVGAGALADEARRCRTACILICDITRPVPNGLILPVLVNELLAAGLSAANITIIVATGLHRPNEGEELRELVGGAGVLEIVNVVNHFARRDEEHAYLGETLRGTAVRVDRRFVDADLRIVTGLVEPHFMAGYSGGRKVIAPGISHAETITRLHSAAFLEDPRAANCVLDGNPLHEEQLEILGMLGGVLAVNTVIDEKRRLSFVNFGDIERSHERAVEFLRGHAVVSVGRRYHTVVTSAAGYPLDKTFYQTVKGMVSAGDLVEPGGDLFIVSECSEGLGSDEYAESQKRLSALGKEGFLSAIIKKDHADIDEWQTEMMLRPMRHANIHLYTTGLTPAELALTGVNNAGALEEAIMRSVRASGDSAVAVIPEGPYVHPEVAY